MEMLKSHEHSNELAGIYEIKMMMMMMMIFIIIIIVVIGGCGGSSGGGRGNVTLPTQ